jgi:hypothetical protein
MLKQLGLLGLLVGILTSCFVLVSNEGTDVVVDADGGWTLSGQSYWKTKWDRKNPLVADVRIRSQGLGEFEVTKKYCQLQDGIVKQDANRFKVFFYAPPITPPMPEAYCNYEIQFKDSGRKAFLNLYIQLL